MPETDLWRQRLGHASPPVDSWKSGKPLFAGDKYAGLSETCLHYIGGIIKHAKALNAFTNPTTNLYKRQVPVRKAPVLLAQPGATARRRAASSNTTNLEGKTRRGVFPGSALANPYLRFRRHADGRTLDGIKKQARSGSGDRQATCTICLPKELKQIPTVCGSLRQALEELDKDRAFLKAGGVFDDDFIDSYIELKMHEVIRFEHTPHPVEFEMYYSA